MMSRRAILLLTSMLATLVAASGVALAANRIVCQINVPCNGTSQSDALIGTAGGDIIHGLGGTDLLLGVGAVDSLHGDEGGDQLLGGSDTDFLYGGPGNDISNGGDSFDTYFFEANNWGQDTITENRAHELNNAINIGPAVTVNLQILLHADNTTSPEVSDAAGIPGTNYTVNWSRDIIRDVDNQSSGNDIVFGNNVGNLLVSHKGTDQVLGAEGDDIIDVQDFDLTSDFVDCGTGNDRVFADKLIVSDIGTLPADIVRNCERIIQ
jgi:Ca2+-binding RTX toxin-like protein